MSKVAIYGAFTKVTEQDDGSLQVDGVASSEARDASGELVRASGMAKALPGYLKWGAVREMHENIAAGTAVSAEVRDDGKTYFTAKVVDVGSVAKVKAGVLKGFSIGGKVLKRDPTDKTIIDELDLIEISLVDRPCNPEASITLVKLEGNPDMPNTTKAAPTEAALPVAAPAPASAPPSAPAAPAAAASPAAPAAAETAKVAAPAGDDTLKKSMYQVAWAANVCTDLSSLASSTQWEADYEGDASPIPARLKALCIELCSILVALVQEECAELCASLPAGTAVVDVVASAEKPGALKKSEKVAAIAKAFVAGAAGEVLEKKGAKFSKATRETLAKCHDHVKAVDQHLKDLAYAQEDDAAVGETKDDGGSDDVAAAAATDDLQKRLGSAESATAQAGEALKKVLAERDELAKALATANVRLEQKGVLKVVPVEKRADSGGTPVVVEDEAALAKMSPVQRAEHELKKTYRSGPMRLA